MILKTARQLFSNNGFNELCKSLFAEFKKRSSKVIEEDHVKLLHLIWFGLRLHRSLERYTCLCWLACLVAFVWLLSRKLGFLLSRSRPELTLRPLVHGSVV